MKTTLFVLLLLINFALSAEPLRFSNNHSKTTLVELYTSEGCSSCPPADKWVSQLKSNPDLWSKLIPLAFHVDYWNYLGWKDRFANKANSNRQNHYRRNGNIQTVYTPGFVVDGKEWRGWFSRKAIPSAKSKAGTLSVTVDGDAVNANFQPAGNSPSGLEFHIAVLGFDIETKVKSGENSGLSLKHDFVVLGHTKTTGTITNNANPSWQTSLPDYQPIASQKYALVAWVNNSKTAIPLQAAGHWWAGR